MVRLDLDFRSSDNWLSEARTTQTSHFCFYWDISWSTIKDKLEISLSANYTFLTYFRDRIKIFIWFFSPVHFLEAFPYETCLNIILCHSLCCLSFLFYSWKDAYLCCHAWLTLINKSVDVSNKQTKWIWEVISVCKCHRGDQRMNRHHGDLHNTASMIFMWNRI